MKTDGNIDVNNEILLQLSRIFNSVLKSDKILDKEVETLKFSFKNIWEIYHFTYNIDEDILERKLKIKNDDPNFYSIIKNGKHYKLSTLGTNNLSIFFIEGKKLRKGRLTNIELRIVEYIFRKAVKYYLYYQDTTKEDSLQNVRIHRFSELHDKITANHSFMEKKYRAAIWLLNSPKLQRKFNKDQEIDISYHKFKDLIKYWGTDKTPFDFLNFDFIFSDGSTFGKLSSGQLQLLNSVNTITYHLANIDSDPYGYEYVSIILDEVELYLHPEFQRRYLKFVIAGIDELSLNRIKGVHIIVITHSPFVLSDIPHTNILSLSERKTNKEINQNTFGANIHKLLGNQYFLKDGFQGQLAIEAINKVYDFLNVRIIQRKISNLEKENSEYFDEELDKLRLELEMLDHAKNYVLDQQEIKIFIGMIGEPIIKDDLEELYNELYSETEKERALKEIRDLMKSHDIENSDI